MIYLSGYDAKFFAKQFIGNMIFSLDAIHTIIISIYQMKKLRLRESFHNNIARN